MKTLFQLYLSSYRGLTKPAWMLALIMLINRSGAMVIPFLSVYMTQSLKFSLKETGIVLSCFGIGAVCGSWLGGWLSDKTGHFKIQLLTLVASIPVFCLLPELKTPLLLAVGVFFLSLITETFRPANSVAIASYTKHEHVTKAFSLNRMAMNLGFSIGPALGGFLAIFSFSWLFYGNALTAALAAIAFYWFFHKLPEIEAVKKKNAESFDERGNISPWKDGYFIIFSVLSAFYAICFFQLLSTIPVFYRQIHQMSEWEIGLILAYSGLVVFSLEMPLVHVAGRRLSGSAVIILGTLLCGLSFLMLLLPGKYLVLYTSMFVLCVSEILAMPFMATVAIKRSSFAKRGAYMGMSSLAFSVSHIFAPYLGTTVAEAYGFHTLWICTGILSVLTAIGFWAVMKKLD